MEGKTRRAMLARAVVACAVAGAMVAWSPAGTDGSPGTSGGATTRGWKQAGDVRPPSDAAWTLGSSMALQGDLLAVGPSHDWDLGEDRGGVHLYERDGMRWSECAELPHPSGDAHANFGASLAIDGGRLVVGSPRDSTRGFQAGAAFVYARHGDRWLLQASLQRPHAMAGDLAGSAVALQGRTLVIGVPKADASGLDTGAVEVFESRDDIWTHAATLTAPMAQVGSFFGITVAVDGACIFVGAPGDDSDGPIAGRVHVFRRGARGWAWEGSVGCPTGPRGWFGASVAAADGTAVAGAPRAMRPQGGLERVRGAAFTLQRRNGTWSCQQTLVPANVSEGDGFGCTVATDGRTVVVGATADCVAGDLAGTAFAFQRQFGGAWRGARIDPVDASPRALIGHGLAVHGPWMAVGRLGDPEADPAPGVVSLFHAMPVSTLPAAERAPPTPALR